jgi:hypothetical protein
MADIDKYRRINEQFSKNLLFRIGGDAGFFSEYNNMVIVMLYCLLHGIRFDLYSRHANFSGGRGWNEFFLPFCRERDFWLNDYFNTRFHRREVHGTVQKVAEEVFNVYMKQRKIDYLTCDLFNDARGMAVDGTYQVPELALKGNLADCCRELSDMIWRYNEPTRKEIEKLMAEVDIVGPYASAHIRRGDKNTEAEFVEVDRYMELIKNNSPEVRNVFVMTDDYSVMDELHEKYSDYKFFTLAGRDEHGYSLKQLSALDAGTKRYNIVKLFAMIEIMSHSELFVGTMSSNPGMYMYWRMPKGKCLGVDFNEWKVW